MAAHAPATSEQEAVEARRQLITACLIATDVDKTIQATANKNLKIDPESDFHLRAGPELARSAYLGVKIACISGNSMPHLCEGVVPLLVRQLCTIKRPWLLEKFHFFGNSGGVYFHFPSEDADLRKLYDQATSIRDQDLAEQIVKQLITTTKTEEGKEEHIVQPRFVNSDYLTRFEIPDSDKRIIVPVLESYAKQYCDEQQNINWQEFDLEIARAKKIVDSADNLETPHVEQRLITYGCEEEKKISVQLALRPVLSERIWRANVSGISNPRLKLIDEIQRAIDDASLACHYKVSGGGDATIDITREKLDKAYALRFLIEHLNIEGSPTKDQKFGSNVIYFGDEVTIRTGNDYPVTQVPGVLIFAVNEKKKEVPYGSGIVTDSIYIETKATEETLIRFNRCANRMIEKPRKSDAKTAVEQFRREWFIERMKPKFEHLCVPGIASGEQLQTIHAMLTVMARDDEPGRQWIRLLNDNFDAIMAQLKSSNQGALPAIGTSHGDSS